MKTGATEIVDVPAPPCRPGCVLIASRVSLISVGTERMLVDFGKAGWIEKARSQPEKVRQVLDKIWKCRDSAPYPCEKKGTAPILGW